MLSLKYVDTNQMAGLFHSVKQPAIFMAVHERKDHLIDFNKRVVMFKLFFILSFFLGFTQVSLAETCDEDYIWLDRVAWAEQVMRSIELCGDKSTYFCVHVHRPCEQIAQGIINAAKLKQAANQEKISANIDKIIATQKAKDEAGAEDRKKEILDELEREIQKELRDN